MRNNPVLNYNAVTFVTELYTLIIKRLQGCRGFLEVAAKTARCDLENFFFAFLQIHNYLYFIVLLLIFISYAESALEVLVGCFQSKSTRFKLF